MKLRINYLHEGSIPLFKKYVHDAGFDIPMWEDTIIKKGKNIVPLGFTLILPPGTMGLLFPRSSVMGDSVIYNQAPFDSYYSSEWNMIINNLGEEFIVKQGERLCQAVIFGGIIYPDLTEEDIQQRGNNGLGSTGK